MLFGDSNVEEPLGEAILEREKSGGSGHRGRDGDDARVRFGFFEDGVGERLGVAGGNRLGRTDRRVENGCVVEVLLVVILGGRIPLALLRQNVHDDGSLGRQVLGVSESDLQVAHVVAVDRADVADSERFEERRRLQEFAHCGLHRLHALLRLLADHGQVLQPRFDATLTLNVERVHSNPREAVRKLLGDSIGEGSSVGAVRTLRVDQRRLWLREVRDRGRVTATVVVQNDDDSLLGVSEIVQRFVRHATGHGTVADHRDDVSMVGRSGIAGHRHSVGVRKNRGCVTVFDEVVLALFATRVAGQTVCLA